MINSDQEIKDLDSSVDVIQEKVNFGNLHVFVDCKFIHLSVGPDFPFTICGLLMMLCFSVAIYTLTSAQQDFAPNFAIVGKIFSLFTPVSFLVTVFSDPGVYRVVDNFEPKTKFCESCKVFKPKSIFHCSRCNICVEGYDHHCPWVSKCIGKKNLISFYCFLTSMILSMFFLFFSVYYTIALNYQKVKLQK